MVRTWKGQTKEQFYKECERDRNLTPEQRKAELDAHIAEAHRQYEEYKKKYINHPKENSDEWLYVNAEKPNSLDDGEATVTWIIVMLVGIIFKERWFIWLVATVLYLCRMNRHAIRKWKWDNGGKEEHYQKIKDAGKRG